MCFLQWVAGLCLRDKGRSSAIRVKCSRQVPPGGSPGTDPGQAEDIIYLGWLGWGRSGLFSLGWSPSDPALDKRKKINGLPSRIITSTRFPENFTYDLRLWGQGHWVLNSSEIVDTPVVLICKSYALFRSQVSHWQTWVSMWHTHMPGRVCGRGDDTL